MSRETFRVQGAEQLGHLSAQLKASGNRELQRKMRRELRLALRPAVLEVKAAALPVSRQVARSITGVFSYSATRASARIVAKRSKMPPGKQDLPQLLQYGSRGSGRRYLRHPVFAERGEGPYVNQPVHPYFYEAIARVRPGVEQRMAKVLDDIAKELRRS